MESTMQTDAMASILQRIATTGGGEIRIRVEPRLGADLFTLVLWRNGAEVGGTSLMVDCAQSYAAVVPNQRISQWLAEAELTLAKLGVD